MFKLTKEYQFEAAHQLDYLPEGHKCRRLHGHNYKVTLEIHAKELDERGFANFDYAELDPFIEAEMELCDHQFLNDRLGGAIYTTAEMIAKGVHDRFVQWLPRRVSVKVEEAPGTSATYEL